jgi:flagella basal body P-ring formation protein FlgA
LFVIFWKDFLVLIIIVSRIKAFYASDNIKKSGLALQDGSLHDMIRVQNIRSQRIISAVVSAVGQVKVEM